MNEINELHWLFQMSVRTYAHIWLQSCQVDDVEEVSSFLETLFHHKNDEMAASLIGFCRSCFITQTLWSSFQVENWMFVYSLVGKVFTLQYDVLWIFDEPNLNQTELIWI